MVSFPPFFVTCLIVRCVGAPALGLALGLQARISLEPASGTFAETCPGGDGALAMLKSVGHGKVRSPLEGLGARMSYNA